jgi:hypothetical protein
MPALSTSDVKTHLRVFHAQDDAYITNILLPTATETVERITGVSVQAAQRSYVVSDEGDQWIVLPIQPHNTAAALTLTYTDAAGVGQTVNNPTKHFSGDRLAVLIEEEYKRPVQINWTTVVADTYINMLVLQLCARLYADRGDSTGAIEGKAQQMLTAMLKERVLA